MRARHTRGAPCLLSNKKALIPIFRTTFFINDCTWRLRSDHYPWCLESRDRSYLASRGVWLPDHFAEYCFVDATYYDYQWKLKIWFQLHYTFQLQNFFSEMMILSLLYFYWNQPFLSKKKGIVSVSASQNEWHSSLQSRAFMGKNTIVKG